MSGEVFYITKNICVYCSSSSALEPPYFRAAEDLGARLAQDGFTLIYGGGNVGLMGQLALAVQEAGGRVVGVLPSSIKDKGIAFERADEMIITGTLRERKAVMEDRADAFIALPGGFGTLEEILEILTLKQLGYHNKPVVFINTENFFDPLTNFFEHLYTRHFAKSSYRKLYHIAADAADALHYIKTYHPDPNPGKWF